MCSVFYNIFNIKSGDTVLQVVEGILRCYVTTLISCKENRNYFNGARVIGITEYYIQGVFFVIEMNEGYVLFPSKRKLLPCRSVAMTVHVVILLHP